jgi:hypothetical protein
MLVRIRNIKLCYYKIARIDIGYGERGEFIISTPSNEYSGSLKWGVNIDSLELFVNISDDFDIIEAFQTRKTITVEFEIDNIKEKIYIGKAQIYDIKFLSESKFYVILTSLNDNLRVEDKSKFNSNNEK